MRPPQRAVLLCTRRMPPLITRPGDQYRVPNPELLRKSIKIGDCSMFTGYSTMARASPRSHTKPQCVSGITTITVHMVPLPCRTFTHLQAVYSAHLSRHVPPLDCGSP